MEYILVGVGGIFGSIFRYVLGKHISQNTKTTFPLGTFIINITGAILLGIVITYFDNKNISLLLGDGFLGAFTTFSTFMYEGFNLIQDKEKVNAFIYVAGSIVIGLLGFVLGTKIGIYFKIK